MQPGRCLVLLVELPLPQARAAVLVRVLVSKFGLSGNVGGVSRREARREVVGVTVLVPVVTICPVELKAQMRLIHHEEVQRAR
jgi:hypothetical protein